MRNARTVSLSASMLVLLVGVVFLYPFCWMFVSSFKANPELFDAGRFWPRVWSLAYWQELWGSEWIPFWRSLGTSFALAFGKAAAASLFSMGAAFVFVISSRRLSGLVSGLAVATILVPQQALALALFEWLNAIGLFDTRLGLVLLAGANGIGFLYFSRVFRQVPRGLIDCARLEGAGEGRLFWTLFPLVRYHLVAFGFVVFAFAWQIDLVSVLVLQTDEKRTLVMQLAALFGGSSRPPVAVLMAGSTVCVIALLVSFAVAVPFMRTALADFLES